MDRFDSMLAVFPIVHLFVAYFKKVVHVRIINILVLETIAWWFYLVRPFLLCFKSFWFVKFAIGMGQILPIYRKDRIYTIRLLPLGGYVRMAGWSRDTEVGRNFLLV